MSKAGALKRIREHIDGQTIQPGMFSTLDELIAQAPFESNSLDQWRAYLQPGRMLNREGVQFPLKGDEVRWSLDPLAARHAGDETFTRDELRELVQLYRPEMRLAQGRELISESGRRVSPDNYLGIPSSWIDEATELELELPPQVGSAAQELRGLGRIRTMDPLFGTRQGERLYHGSPSAMYEESVTGMGGLNYPSHFDPDTLSWSRTTTHYPGGQGERSGSVRLIEEIQSDLHSRASDRTYTNRENNQVISQFEQRVMEREGLWNPDEWLAERVGYADQQIIDQLDDVQSELRALTTARANLQQEIEELGGGQNLTSEQLIRFSGQNNEIGQRMDYLRRLEQLYRYKVPDAPYRGPRDYGALELRKQLVNAVEEGNEYLALTRGQDQVARYGGDADRAAGMEYVYDQLYRGELERLARRYGAEIVDVPVTTSMAPDVRPPLMQEFGMESIDDFIGYAEDNVGTATRAVDSAESVSDAREIVEMISDRMGDDIEDLGYTRAEVQGLTRDLRELENDVMALYEGTSADRPGYPEQWAERVDAPFKSLLEDLRHLYEGYEEMWQGAEIQVEDKTFPAMHITPEVADRVRRAGTPQFALGGLVQKYYQGGGVEESPWPWVADMTREDWLEWHRKTEEARIRRQQLAEERRQRYAEEWEKGDVRDDDSVMLDTLKAVTRSLAGAVPGLPPEMREWMSDTMRYPFTGIASQWQSLDPETGEASFVPPRFEIPPPTGMYGYMPTGSPQTEEARQRANAEIRRLREEKPFRPNIIDETISIAALPSMLGWTDSPPPEWAQEAMERSAEVTRQIREEMEVPDPEGFIQGTAEGLGIMAGQVPVPGSAIKTLSRPFMGNRALRYGTAIPRAGVEFFSPIVTPRPGSYMSGALFGGALTELPEHLAPPEEDMLGGMSPAEFEMQELSRRAYTRDTWAGLGFEGRVELISDPRVGAVVWNYLSDEDKDEFKEALRLYGYDIPEEEDDAEQE